MGLNFDSDGEWWMSYRSSSNFSSFAFNFLPILYELFFPPGILQPTLTSLRCAASLLKALAIVRQMSVLEHGVSILGMVG